MNTNKINAKDVYKFIEELQEKVQVKNLILSEKKLKISVEK